jgi:N-acetylmuramoyl-L-alanine amidase
MKKIIIDPGHGGTDPGAIGFDVRECDVALRLARGVGDRIMLRENTEVLYTHLGEGKSLADRVRAANDLDAHLFVSMHCNSFHDPSANGFEVFTSRGETKADAVATAIYGRVSAAFPSWTMRTDWTDGDIDKEAGFYVLKHTKMRAVLIECGFITNPVDHFIMTDRPTSTLLTEAIAQGIIASV